MKSQNRLASLISLFVVACLLALPMTAFAKKGRDHFSRGLDYEKHEQWEKAAQEFTLAYPERVGRWPAALTILSGAYWPGNLDHLQSVVANMQLLRGEITPDLVKRLLGESASPNQVLAPEITTRFFELPLREAREAFERIYFEQLLGREQSNMSKVAEKAGLERTHLYRKLKQLNIRFSRRTDDSATT